MCRIKLDGIVLDNLPAGTTVTLEGGCLAVVIGDGEPVQYDGGLSGPVITRARTKPGELKVEGELEGSTDEELRELASDVGDGSRFAREVAPGRANDETLDAAVESLRQVRAINEARADS